MAGPLAAVAAEHLPESWLEAAAGGVEPALAIVSLAAIAAQVLEREKAVVAAWQERALGSRPAPADSAGPADVEQQVPVAGVDGV